MVIFKQVLKLQDYLQKLKTTNPSIGFVPTMGALHQGHLSLLAQSKQVTDKTVCSIFINPTQFNNAEDFKKYPVTIEQDILLLEKNGCDVLFLPSIKEIYPGVNISKEHFDLGYLENILEGKYRPGHFQGVCAVVQRFLNIIKPAYLLVGQKDYQQCLVLQRLLYLNNFPVKLIICATAREKDGLAMSSRNLRLNEAERALAPGIYQALLFVKEKIKLGPQSHLKQSAVEFLTNRNFIVDYIEIAHQDNLQVVENWNGRDSIIILAAAQLNNVRLIDNLKH